MREAGRQRGNAAALYTVYLTQMTETAFLFAMLLLIDLLCAHAQRGIQYLVFEIKQTWVKSSNFALFIKQFHHGGLVGMYSINLFCN